MTSTTISEHGVYGDRALALLDIESGHIASAKNPRKWSVLALCSAAFVMPPRLGQPLPPVRIVLPNGKAIESSDPAINHVLSELCGRAVRLVAGSARERGMREANRAPVEKLADTEQIVQEPLALAAPADSLFDVAPLHLLTTATLAQLSKAYVSGDFDVRRFRPNLVIRTEAAGFIENDWIGQRIQVGAALFDIIDPTPRCVVTTLARPGLERDIDILRAAQHNHASSVTLATGMMFAGVVGVYAQPVAGSEVHVGEPIRIG